MIYIFSPAIIKTQCFLLSPPFLFLCDYQASYFTDSQASYYYQASYIANQLCKPITFLSCPPVRLYHFCRNPPLSLLQISFFPSVSWLLSASRTLIHWQWKYKIVSIWKTIWQFITNFSIAPYNSIIHFLFLLYKRNEKIHYKKARTSMFKAPN